MALDPAEAGEVTPSLVRGSRTPRRVRGQHHATTIDHPAETVPGAMQAVLKHPATAHVVFPIGSEQLHLSSGCSRSI
jgi:hypothetical protein